MPNRLTRNDYRIIGIVIFVAAISLAVTLKYFWRAFPEASIEFNVGRDESTGLADKFLADEGLRTSGYRHAAIFDFEETAKLYLERTLGLERLNELTRAGGKIRVWRWSHRWFKPLEKEELRVQVTPAGEIAGFRRELPETAPGANLGGAAAREIAERFLSNTMRRDMAQLEFLESTEEKRPARTDHLLTWKDKTVDLGDGSQRIAVSISGDQVAGYREFIHIPEEWMRQYQELRSRNDSAQIVDEVFWILLSVAMVVVLIRRIRIQDVPVRLSLGFGAVAACLVFLDALNTFSLSQFSYSTADTYSGFIAVYLLRSILTALGAGVGIFLIVAASEPIYRESFPQLPSIGRTLTWRGLRSRSFFMANVVGIGLTFFFFAYQTVFYLVANRLGAWAPSDVPFSDQLNTAIPWVAVLFGGFAPAVLEEMQFRAFAIPFLRRALRFWPAAIVVAAFNWGFLHSAYPNQPFYIRGIEVGVGGVIIGVIMLRFGVIATMIWHYSVDALYTAFILLRSPNLYLKFSGALAGGIMLIPLAIALIAYLRAGAFSEEDSISNAAAEKPSIPAETLPASQPKRAFAYAPLDSRRIALAGILIAAFSVLAIIPAYRFGEDVRVGVTRDGAISAADNYLAQRKVAAGDYRKAAWLDQNVDSDSLKYLFEHTSVKEAAGVYKKATRLLLWNVRYFRSLEKEEHTVYVDAMTGKVFGYRHLLAEDTPGASLSPEEAQKLAEKTAVENGYNLSEFELESSQAQKQKMRQDYTFVWEARPGDPRNVADARYRIEADLAGDQVAGFRRYFKLPEEWLRQRSSSGIGTAVLTGFRVLLFGAILSGLVILFVKAVRGGSIRWIGSAKIAVLAGLLTAVAACAQLDTIDRGYDTSIALSTFRAFQVIGIFVSALLMTLLVWVFAALATSLYPNIWDFFNARSRLQWRRDALVALVLMLVAIAGTGQVNGFLTNWFHTVAPAEADIIPGLFDAYFPGATIFLQTFAYSLLFACAGGAVLYMVKAGVDRGSWWFWAAVVLVLIALGPPGARSVSEYFAGWIMRFIPLAVGVYVVGKFFRNNVLAYAGAALCLMVFNSADSLLRQQAAFYKWNGVLLLALTALVLAWLFRPFDRRRIMPKVYDMKE